MFLPGMAVEGCAGLRLPALETLLARAEVAPAHEASLEAWLCGAFGVDDGALAPVTLLADGGQPGKAYWMRADPVHLMLRGSEIVLRSIAPLTAEEAAQFCETLNRHFAEEELHFIAPHPERWYLRMERPPGVETHPLAHVAGRDIRGYLPHGPGALKWHKVLNEIQMLLHGHPVNTAREARGEWSVNSIWPWGGGYVPAQWRRPFSRIYTDNTLAAAFAAAAGIGRAALPGAGDAIALAEGQDTLVVWGGLGYALEHGDIGDWRDSLQAFEQACIRPALQALRDRKIERLSLDVFREQSASRYTLTPQMARRFWRLRRRLSHYS